jgi:tannase/feruloyl esterase
LFGDIDTDNPDLSAFRDAGAKMLTYQGLADKFVPTAMTKNYYQRTAALVGGIAKLQDFHRLYFIPGAGHCGGVGSVNGLPGVSPPANPPLPTQDQMFDALVAWVEKRIPPPTAIVVKSTDGASSRPLCLYPQRITYIGGDVNSAVSYACVITPGS